MASAIFFIRRMRNICFIVCSSLVLAACSSENYKNPEQAPWFTPVLQYPYEDPLVLNKSRDNLLGQTIVYHGGFNLYDENYNLISDLDGYFKIINIDVNPYKIIKPTCNNSSLECKRHQLEYTSRVLETRLEKTKYTSDWILTVEMLAVPQPYYTFMNYTDSLPDGFQDLQEFKEEKRKETRSVLEERARPVYKTFYRAADLESEALKNPPRFNKEFHKKTITIKEFYITDIIKDALKSRNVYAKGDALFDYELYNIGQKIQLKCDFNFVEKYSPKEQLVTSSGYISLERADAWLVSLDNCSPVGENYEKERK